MNPPQAQSPRVFRLLKIKKRGREGLLGLPGERKIAGRLKSGSFQERITAERMTKTTERFANISKIPFASVLVFIDGPLPSFLNPHHGSHYIKQIIKGLLEVRAARSSFMRFPGSAILKVKFKKLKLRGG